MIEILYIYYITYIYIYIYIYYIISDNLGDYEPSNQAFQCLLSHVTRKFSICQFWVHVMLLILFYSEHA